ncbi:MAG TPA: c-type cytochrome [Gemmatimonadales bacterium]|nr:c-type cytochrome [Gemmatimonadales bacterium]
MTNHSIGWALRVGTGITLAACGTNPAATDSNPSAAVADQSGEGFRNGRQIFRFDTYGDDQFWTDTLGLNKIVEQSVDPTTALSVGLKVDASVLPDGILQKVDLKSPATTVALLKLNAVVGIQATVDEQNHITKLGITCAFCHSTVDNSLAPGIGRRLDGWPNGDLNVGALIALSPVVTPAQKAVFLSWGPGKYDPRFNIDGLNTPLVIPPAYGLANVKNETYTAEGPISYWNAYVAVTQMHGHGNFTDPRLGISITQKPDLVTSKLPALREYQHSLPVPSVVAGGFNPAMAERGKAIFNRSCAGCHVGGNGTDNNSGVLHAPSETGMDPGYAHRTTNKAYRTTPLRGLVHHPPYFHDGTAATLADVVAHYNRVRNLGLNPDQQRQLVEYLKTL